MYTGATDAEPINQQIFTVVVKTVKIHFTNACQQNPPDVNSLNRPCRCEWMLKCNFLQDLVQIKHDAPEI